MQSGNGVPTHISPKGTEYTDLDTAIVYINKNGVSFWAEFLDSTFVITGGTGSYFTGGTVTGPTNFLNGVSANTISATTYYGLPSDVRVTGGTYSSGTILFTNNTGGTFTVTGLTTGGSFTGGTVAGLTATTISATTYQNLPTDIRVTGGTYSSGTILFTNNTGGTFTVSGFSTSLSDAVTFTQSSPSTGWTFTHNLGIDKPLVNVYDATNKIIIPQEISAISLTTLYITFPVPVAGYVIAAGGNFNVTGSTGSTTVVQFTGGTVSGATNFTGGVSANTISATTYYNLPTDIRVTGGTYNNGTATFTNNTGGTFNVTGLTTPFTGGTVTGGTDFTGGLTANTLATTSLITAYGGLSGSSVTTPIVQTPLIENTSNFKIYLDTYSSIIGVNNSGYDWNFLPSGAFRVPNTIFGGTYDGNQVALGGIAKVSALRNNIIEIETGTGGTVDNKFTFLNDIFYSPTVSATTYLNLPTDIRQTGATYSNNNFTFTNNTGGTFNVLFNTVTGLTVNGNLTVTGSTISPTHSGVTFISTGTYGSTTMSTSNTLGLIVFSGSGTIGGTGYTDFIRVTNTAAGATNPNKTFRLNNIGGLEIINSAYSSPVLSLTDSGSLNVPGNITASGYTNLPNSWLHALRNTNQTIPSGTWADRDVVFNTYSSNNFTYNQTTGIATLRAGKTYRITARLAWSEAAVYLTQFRIYNQTTSSFTGPTAEIVQSTNTSNNISDSTLEHIIFVGASDMDISIRTTSATNALNGEYIRGDLNTQLIIQQIA
jgi:hypothetical protein